ncbi:DUF1033 family protein [Staphylococcus pseudintermedius]|uniref:DUF1033 family protein n=1 Tax=Staphylococcus pseudintermedius TaxID=283734 RepID=UPI0018F42BB5|nr:DUF1033 family protein [Staphylococcus pseudintermedius]EGQ3109487.1 DUF1033 family protein [Staphylococcus pseudintermedius]EKO8601156.1 DUF1033 family protein [Staphylococcus pseudintermedius]EKO8603109.1 DUF1033 family protein [Staphylococcus pseudintermedius]MBJ8279197.1 DUF1033 family protein [Staphylococcus pseudintermedius]MDK3799219.1 regulatory protein MsaA [Staphylococcus pseudintermedius]
MWEVAKIRADYEGWWLFDDWPEHIIDSQKFETFEAFEQAYQHMIQQAKTDYDNFIVGKHNIHAFYNNCDLNFCEDCDEDLQIFYSFITLKNEKIYLNLPIID